VALVHTFKVVETLMCHCLYTVCVPPYFVDIQLKVK